MRSRDKQLHHDQRGNVLNQSSSSKHFRLFVATIFLGLSHSHGQNAVVSPSSITSEQIARRLTAANAERAAQLVGYTAERHYTVSYRGFPAPLTASMTVDVTYTAPSTKTFHVVSHIGAKLLFDEILSKLLKSEEDAAHEPAKTAMSSENYTFILLGEEMISNRRSYVLHVEPRSDSKFLYRGKVWVDAGDYAVAKIEAEPAKNPSFWIKDTKVHHEYARTDQFWLPASNRSETTMRFGGTAVLTIDYGKYEIHSTKPGLSPAN
jgi:hypothetical protein